MARMTTETTVGEETGDGADVTDIRFLRRSGGDWVAQITIAIVCDGQLKRRVFEFLTVPSGIETALDNTVVPLALTAARAVLVAEAAG